MIYNPKELQEIGILIKKSRGENSQGWLAEKVGTKTAAISYIESGKRPVPQNKIPLFAKTLNIDASRLIPTKMDYKMVRREVEELADMGIGFREMQTLTPEAKEKLVKYYEELKAQSENGSLGNKKSIEDTAKEVLSKAGIKTTPVDLLKILSKFKINLEESFEIEADGIIVFSRSQRWGGIKYRAGLSEGRKRFTIAHELGHFFLDNVNGFETKCCMDGEGKNREQERQADEFASHLLMPKEWVSLMMSKNIKGIQDVLGISKQFGVSQQAAAIRLVQLSEQPCAVICSKENRIAWGNTSNKLYARINKGASLSRATQAYKLYKGSGGVNPIKTKSEYWLDSKINGKFYEQSSLLYKDTVLSLLWAK